MKRTDLINITVQMPVADVLNTLAPQIDDIVKSRVVEIRQQLKATRSQAAALSHATDELVSAITRYENSQHTRDERAAVNNLIAAAKGFRKAHRAYKRGY